MKVVYVEREQIARNIYSFYFKPEKPVHYIAGQFIELYLPHDYKDKRGNKRWFTLSSAPHEARLAITTKFASETGSTFKQALWELPENTEMSMASPMGDFVLPKDPAIPLLFVAGGIGCTPFRSIISELQTTGEQRDITLLYSAQSKQDVAFRNTFTKLGKKFIPVYARLSAEQVTAHAPISPAHYVYISGPEPMVEALSEDLKNAGTNKKHIYGDFFPNYPAE